LKESVGSNLVVFEKAIASSAIGDRTLTRHYAIARTRKSIIPEGRKEMGGVEKKGMERTYLPLFEVIA